MATPPGFSDAFEALRKKFTLSLPERLQKMRQLLAEFDSEKGSAFIAEAHKLAGACGTFGHTELGLQAKRLELLAEELLADAPERQKQVLPLLESMMAELIIQSYPSELRPDLVGTSSTGQATHSAVWLLQDHSEMLLELTTQLRAFGFDITVLNHYHSCLELLQRQIPAVLYTASHVSGQPLFEQQGLLKCLHKYQVPLLVYSTQDSFALRIKAAQLRAQAFFISEQDTHNIVAAVTELVEQQNKPAGRVAVIEDDDLLSEHYQLVLQAAGYQTYKVESLTNMVEELLRFKPDLLLMDMYMPEFSGAELAGVLRQYQAFKRLPIVFLSSEQNKTLQIQALSHGADDFLTKPIDDMLLVQSIKVRLDRSLEIRRLIEKDGLTNLIKHSAIKEFAAIEFERAYRSDKPLSIVMLDIDFFKRVNDNYGHAAGDQVIATLANLLRKRIRKTDRAGRYGGEEFLLVLPECSALKAIALLEEILSSFRLVSFSSASNPFSCTFSAGIAATGDNSFVNVDAMIEAADAALYKAKQAGRNRVC